MNIEVIRGDITQIKVDVIVNAANSSLMGGGGVDGAIHRAGGPQILEECKQIRATQGGCPTGEAVMTNAGNLPSLKVIHTVGPVWHGGESSEVNLLSNCYQNALAMADRNGYKSIAFPNISTGIFHFPKDLAARTAISAVRDYERHHPVMGLQSLTFVCFDSENFEIYNKLLRVDL